MSLNIVADVEKRVFAVGEPVVLVLEARNEGQGVEPGLSLSGGAPGAPSVELHNLDTGEVSIVATDVYEVSPPPRPPRPLFPGGTAQGRLQLDEFAGELAPGRYEATVVIDQDRSNPVELEVEPAALLAASAAPLDSGGHGPRTVVRLEARGGAARLVLAQPVVEGHDAEIHRHAHDLGPERADAQVAVAVASPEGLELRHWAVALSGRSLRRTFLDGESSVYVFPEVELPLAGRLVAALAGEKRAPAPPPALEPERPTTPDLSRGIDSEPWPELHVALIAGRELAAASLAPDVAARPVVRRVPLAGDAAAALGLALTPSDRIVLVAHGERDAVSIVRHGWSASGLAAGERVLSVEGTFLALEAAVVAGSSDARLLVLARPRDPAAGVLALHEAILPESGPAVALPPRFFAAEDVPAGLDLAPGAVRLRADSSEPAWILGSRAGSPVAWRVGDSDAQAVTAPQGFFDVEFAGGRVSVLEVDRAQGVVATLLD